jgi:hypothetical protein
MFQRGRAPRWGGEELRSQTAGGATSQSPQLDCVRFYLGWIAIEFCFNNLHFVQVALVVASNCGPDPIDTIVTLPRSGWSADVVQELLYKIPTS